MRELRSQSHEIARLLCALTGRHCYSREIWHANMFIGTISQTHACMNCGKPPDWLNPYYDLVGGSKDIVINA